MSQSTGSRSSRKALAKPKKPYAAFPLTPHASGKWQKKIRGKIHYFGAWARRVNGELVRVPKDGWEEAERLYNEQAADLHAGRQPSANKGGLNVAELCNLFLAFKQRKVDAGELGGRMFDDYKRVTDLLVKEFGNTTKVLDLTPADFGRLRASLAKRWGPTRMCNAITRVKGVFKFGFENDHIDRPVKYGTELARPEKPVLRRHRAKQPKKMIAAAELRRLIESAEPTMKAMILLGLNCGLGNHDCATLPRSALDLKAGWADYPRPKTGIDRRAPLWEETVAAIQAALAARPEPSDPADSNLVFISSRKTGFIRTTAASHTDLITVQFGALLKQFGLHQKGLGFYTLRHVFRTIADEARDPVAIDVIMGHSDPSMGAAYRERIEDTRLRAVTDHVHAWLFSKDKPDTLETPA